MTKLEALPEGWEAAVDAAHHNISHYVAHDVTEKLVIEDAILAFLNHLIESGVAHVNILKERGSDEVVLKQLSIRL
jgi:hypothetical protein